MRVRIKNGCVVEWNAGSAEEHFPTSASHTKRISDAGVVWTFETEVMGVPGRVSLDLNVQRDGTLRGTLTTCDNLSNRRLTFEADMVRESPLEIPASAR